MLGAVCRLVFLLEGIAMLVTGPILMAWPREVLAMYGARSTTDGGAVAWFGALVLLMGWVETRKLGKLDRAEVEAWLLADVAYAYCFARWVSASTAGWNFWSVFSVLFPVLWAPLRVGWLCGRGDYR